MKNAKNYILLEYFGALLIALLIVSAIDLLTNRVDVTRYGWDYVHYISMAEKGIIGNTFISAPFAYRIVTPMAARLLITIFPLSTETAFLILTYIGTISSLVLIFALAKRFNANFGTAIIVMLAIGLSFYHGKYVVFDMYRPDPLAYPVIILAMFALFDKRYLLCIVLSVLGMLIREFVVIPAAIVGVLWIVEIRGFIRQKSLSKLYCLLPQ